MAQTIVGIDFGSYSVKICAVERVLKDFELTHFYEQVVPQGTRLTREEAAATSLRQLLEKNPMSIDWLSVSYPAHLASTRVIELPFSNQKKIEQTVDFELESHVPLPIEDLLIDYHILSTQENKSTVLLAYTPRARFAKFLSVLQSAGVDPRYVSLDLIDLAHMGQVAMVPSDGVYAMVDIGHEKTNLVIMEGQKLQYARTITVGGLHFTRALQKAFNLNYERAESLKLDRGKVSYLNEEPDQISRLMHKVGEEILVAIRQSYMGYRQLYPGKMWAGLYLCGGGSRLPGLADMMSLNLRMNVFKLDFIDVIPNKIPEADRVGDIMPVSFSQAVKVIFPAKAVRINFRQDEFAYQRDIQAIGSEMRQVVGWFVLVFVLAIVYFSYSYFSIKSKINLYEYPLAKADLSTFPKELSVDAETKMSELMSSLKGKITETKNELEIVKPGNHSKVMQLLNEVTSKMPPKEEVPIDIDEFTFTGTGLRIVGRTNSFDVPENKIKAPLMASPYFKNVSSATQKGGGKDEVKFTITMDLASRDDDKAEEKGSKKDKKEKKDKDK